MSNGMGGAPEYDPLFFPFPPNWKTPLNEGITYDSWVLTSEDGGEQTGSRSGTRPRRSLDWQVQLDRENAQRLENMLFAYQSREWFVAHWAENATLQADAAVGATVLNVPTTGLNVDLGRHVALFKSPQQYEVVEIAGSSASSITVNATTQPWPAGTKVYPLYVGYINASLSGKRLTDSLIQMPVSFLLEPSLDVSPATGAAAATYRGVELYLGKTNWAAAMDASYRSDVRVFDLKTGKIRQHSASRFTAPARDHTWLLKDRAEIAAFRQFLARREGVAVPFYASSGVSDFTLTEDLVATTSYITVSAQRYGPLAAAHPARRDIIVHLRDGSYVARRVLSVAAHTPTSERLMLDAALPANVPRSAVKRVSFLNFYRLNTTGATLRYLTDSVATCELPFVAKRGILDLTSTTGTPPNGTQGRLYSFQYSAKEGHRPYTWSFLSGTLPPGTQLTSTGLLTGILSTAGSYTWTVKAVDVEGNEITVTRSITVAAATVVEIVATAYEQSSVHIGNMASVAALRDDNIANGPGTSSGGMTTSGSWNALEYMKLDLGALHTISRVVVGGGYLYSGFTPVAEHLNGARLQVSTNNTSWTTVLSFSGVTDTGQLDKEFAFAETQARYVRIAARDELVPVAAATFRVFGFAVG